MSQINVSDLLTLTETNCSCEVGLTQDQKDEILESFTLYDRDGDGLIKTSELGKVMRSLGQVPTVCEETDIVAQFALEECDDIDYLAFVKLMTVRWKEFDEENELLESFRTFDKEENGFICVDELKNMLTTMGEMLTQEEADEWLNDGQDFIQNGKLFYEDFVSFMLSK